jgi:hypothetical protein
MSPTAGLQTRKAAITVLFQAASVLTFGTQVRAFAPGRSRRIFMAKKFSARLPSEGK